MLKVLVPVKRVVDPYVRIRVQSDGKGIDTQSLKMVMNPFDEIALEEALRLKEKGQVGHIVVASIGDALGQETLRHGLALGADEAILIDEMQATNSYDFAYLLKNLIIQEGFDLVMMGKQAIDSDANQTPQMLAALLDWPQATFISKIEIKGEIAEVVRETDIGLESMAVMLPAVVSVDLRLNEPRYASLPNIMRAKSKPLKVIQLPLENTEEYLQIDNVTPPKARAKGVIVTDAQELLEKLKPVLFS